MPRSARPLTVLFALLWIAAYALALVLSGRWTTPGLPWWAFGSPAPGVLVRLGALPPRGVAAADLPRLLSYAFLHGSLLDLLFGVWVWWSLGGLLERIAGSLRVAFVFVLAALAGALAHEAAGGGLLVGSWAGVFGAAGGLGVWSVVARGPEAAAIRRQVLVFLILSVLLVWGLGAPPAAFAGGLGGGVLAVLLLGPHRLDRPSSAGARLAGAAALLLLAAAVGLQARGAARAPGARGEALLRDLRAAERLADRLYESPQRARPEERVELGRRLDALLGMPWIREWPGGAALTAYVEAWRPVAEGNVPDPPSFDARMARARAAWRPWRERLADEAGAP